MTFQQLLVNEYFGTFKTMISCIDKTWFLMEKYRSNPEDDEYSGRPN